MASLCINICIVSGDPAFSCSVGSPSAVVLARHVAFVEDTPAISVHQGHVKGNL